MTPLDAMKQALDFIERHSNRWDGVNGEHPMTTVTNLRSAIAELEKLEPVALEESK